MHFLLELDKAKKRHFSTDPEQGALLLDWDEEAHPRAPEGGQGKYRGGQFVPHEEAGSRVGKLSEEEHRQHFERGAERKKAKELNEAHAQVQAGTSPAQLQMKQRAEERAKAEAGDEPWRMTKAEFEGGPDVVYHGGSGEYEIDTDRGGSSTGNPTSDFGAFFTPDRREAERYVKDFHGGKGVVQTVRLKMKNPYHMSFGEFDKIVGVEWQKMSLPEGIQELRDRVHRIKGELIAEGHDGIIVGSPGKPRAQEIIAFNKEAIQQHKYEVARALAEGKPVPAEVLADYPDLAGMKKGVPSSFVLAIRGALDLSKSHDVSHEPRDAEGRWTTGGKTYPVPIPSEPTGTLSTPWPYEDEPKPILPEDIKAAKAQAKAGTLIIGDRYRDTKSPKEVKGIDPYSGDERYGYAYTPDAFIRSHATGAMCRYYVVLNNGAIVHPDELMRAEVKADGSVKIPTNEELIVSGRGMTKRKWKTFENAIWQVSATYPRKDATPEEREAHEMEVYTITSPDARSITATRKEWRAIHNRVSLFGKQRYSFQDYADKYGFDAAEEPTPTAGRGGTDGDEAHEPVGTPTPTHEPVDIAVTRRGPNLTLRAKRSREAEAGGQQRLELSLRSLKKGAGWSDTDERMYEHIKQQAKESGRYGDRAEEVAARTVNKLRSRRKRLVMRNLEKDED